MVTGEGVGWRVSGKRLGERGEVHWVGEEVGDAAFVFLGAAAGDVAVGGLRDVL